MTDLSALFFRPMHSAMSCADNGRCDDNDEAARMRASLDAIVLNGSDERIFPRTASKRADAVIERMVKGVIGVAHALGSAERLAAHTKKVDMGAPLLISKKSGRAKGHGATDAAKPATPFQQQQQQQRSTLVSTAAAAATDQAISTPMSDSEAEDNLTRSEREELEEYGADVLGESEDEALAQTARDMEEDADDDDDSEQGEKLYDSSDDQELERTGAAYAGVDDDDEEENVRQWVDGISRHDDDDDDSDAGGSSSDMEDDEDDEDEDKEDKKTKPAGGRSAKAKPKTSSEKSKPTTTTTTTTHFRKEQANMKRKRNEEFNQLDDIVSGYVEVAAWQASGYAPKLRELLLGEPQTEKRTKRLAHCLTTLEAHMHLSLSLARKATPQPYTEIVDFVKGAAEIASGPAQRAEQASQCDILQREPKSGESLVCLRALHSVRSADGVGRTEQWKTKVCMTHLLDLIKSLHFVHNLMPLTETMCNERLRVLKKHKKIETTVATDVQTLLADSTKVAVPTVFKRQLKNALDKIDTSVRKLK
jgi:hypothetical protein